MYVISLFIVSITYYQACTVFIVTHTCFIFVQAAQLNQKSSAHEELDDMFRMPAVQYGESPEEQALLKEQQRHQEEIKQRQRDELQTLQAETDRTTKDEESKLNQHFQRDLEQAIREKKNRQAAEIQARPDLTKEQMNAVSCLFVMSLYYPNNNYQDGV